DRPQRLHGEAVVAVDVVPDGHEQPGTRRTPGELAQVADRGILQAPEQLRPAGKPSAPVLQLIAGEPKVGGQEVGDVCPVHVTGPSAMPASTTWVRIRPTAAGYWAEAASRTAADRARRLRRLERASMKPDARSIASRSASSCR